MTLDELLKGRDEENDAKRQAAPGAGAQSMALPVVVAMTVVAMAQSAPAATESEQGADVTIAVDDASNSLILLGSPRSIERLSALIKQMQEQLAQMPPEQRAQIEKMMAQRMPGFGKQNAQEFRKTSRADKIAGYPCSYVEILEDGALTDELCVATSGSIKGGAELMDAGARMSALLRDMMSTLEAPWLRQMMERQVANYEKLGGVPVLSRHYLEGKPAHETTFKSVRTETIPASAFEVPAGYTKKDLMARPSPRP